jgi:hypothetical protein
VILAWKNKDNTGKSEITVFYQCEISYVGELHCACTKYLKRLETDYHVMMSLTYSHLLEEKITQKDKTKGVKYTQLVK